MTEKTTEEILIDLLKDIINLLKTEDWVVADYTGNFNNEVSLLTNKVVEKTWNMSVSLQRIR